jgi:hypothetical protein
MFRLPVIPPIVCLVFVLLISGCGPDRRPTVETTKVSGTVQVDGKPVDGAKVNFLGVEYAGVATTDANGHYELDAQPGENKVYVVKLTGVPPGWDETMLPGASDAPGAGGPKQLLPKKYSDQFETELRFTVPEDGSNAANFDLTTK